MDIKAYYRAIHAKRAELAGQFAEGHCYVAPVKTPNNGACEVPICLAAKLLVDATHRLANSQEVEAYQQHQAMVHAVNAGVTVEAARERFGIAPTGKGK